MGQGGTGTHLPMDYLGHMVAVAARLHERRTQRICFFVLLCVAN